jgi:zinc/manganese transport system permease protein
VLSVCIALVTVWVAIASSYQTNWPIGFFVGAFGAFDYGVGRVWAAGRRSRTVRKRGREGDAPIDPSMVMA